MQDIQANDAIGVGIKQVPIEKNLALDAVRVIIANTQILMRPTTFVTAIFSPLPQGQRGRVQSITQS